MNAIITLDLVAPMFTNRLSISGAISHKTCHPETLPIREKV